jgi:uncharacterized protein (DUF488 family)
MALFSIGHSNLPAAELVRLLTQHRIAVLVDVRSRPFSRFNPQFNRSALAGTLERAGIAYQWRGEYLGGRGSTRVDSPEFVAAMDEVISVAADRNVALMCAEADPATCHRTSKLGAFLARRRAIALSHITASGLLTQAEVTATQQPGLFDR